MPKTANKMLKNILGMDNVDTASSFSDLGIVLQSLGRHAKALDCLKIALDIQHRVLPGNHPQTAVVLASIGSILNDMNKKEEALDYYKRALAIHQNALSANNDPDQELIAIVYNNIASILSSMHQYEKALDNCIDTIAIHENAPSRNHPHQVAFYENEANALRVSKHFTETKQRRLGVLKIMMIQVWQCGVRSKFMII
jgi:tetratricopeptide (TPR) repeat protein